jgi:hypothetical protein
MEVKGPPAPMLNVMEFEIGEEVDNVVFRILIELLMIWPYQAFSFERLDISISFARSDIVLTRDKKVNLSPLIAMRGNPIAPIAQIVALCFQRKFIFSPSILLKLVL